MRVGALHLALISITYIVYHTTLQAGGNTKVGYVLGKRVSKKDDKDWRFNINDSEHRWYATLEEAGDVFTKLNNGQAVPDELKGATLVDLENEMLQVI